MNEQICKYELGFPKTILLMPKGAEIIAVQPAESPPPDYSDQNEPHTLMWARVDPEADQEAHTIFAVGTGMNFDAGSATYIGTVQANGYVWHYFDDDEATWERD